MPLPTAAAFTGSTVTEDQFKAALTEQRGFLAGLLGATGELPAAYAALAMPFGRLGGLTANTALTAADSGKVLSCTGTFTVTLPVGAAGLSITLRNYGTGDVTIAAAAGGTVDGSATLMLASEQVVTLVADGVTWRSLGNSGRDSSGTNANGSFVKLSDGTMICWRTVPTAARSSTSQAGGLYRATMVDYPYPATFGGGVACGGIMSNPFELGFFVQADLLTTVWRVGGARIADFAAVSVPAVNLMAMGRWR